MGLVPIRPRRNLIVDPERSIAKSKSYLVRQCSQGTRSRTIYLPSPPTDLNSFEPTMFRDASPSLGSAHFSTVTGDPPPSPPFYAQTDPLDDIYGSEPDSPGFDSHAPFNHGSRDDEILSDLPSRQRALDTDAYREGLSNSKGQFVQEGFDEGYSLGADIGQRVGYILGVLQGFVAALMGHDEPRWKEARALWEDAQKELAIGEIMGQKWVDQEGIWKWEVLGEEEEVTFREVAEQHPIIKLWNEKVRDIARKWGVDLEALERNDEHETTEQS
ncbi:hypothetical protein K504DRAFT_455473 [Pleomassaria siparia CBS 279.74]|uniref:Protein YAE1 n=1 Tax=Pleomassaria siparia CBS 279.74 TaxID=1314801 RepID=A0A6G1KAA3_9PLEO|nr:hypothetical protein K504DRAFT_455473 [Pleomassaria siparia CBS 279.74]